MNAKPIIRPYKSSDRAQLRQLMLDTAEIGQPTAFPDPELLADMITLYYTDAEPGSTWILEQDGRLVGYLTGCLDTQRYLAWMKRAGYPRMIFRFLWRDIYRPTMLRWLLARIKTLKAGGAHREEWVSKYPAHLHINLSSEVRGQGLGRALMERFLEQVRTNRVAGVYLATRGDNTSGQRFFAQCGFKQLAEIRAWGPGKKEFQEVVVVIMARLAAGSQGPQV